MKIYIRAAKNNIEKNLDVWGSSPNTNILFILGYSGSGKSTLAKQLASEYDADVINLDVYFIGMMEQELLGGSISTVGHSASFDSYCKSHFPDYVKFCLPKEEITMEEYSELLPGFEDTLLDYGEYMYSRGKRVIVEGVQLMDDTLFPDKAFFKSVPTILLTTSLAKSSWRGAKRDKINPINYLRNLKYNKMSRDEYKNVKKAIHSSTDISDYNVVEKDIKLGNTPAKEYLWFDGDNKVAQLHVFDWWDGLNIEDLEISPEYRGQGLSYKLLDFATKELGAKNLAVAKDNKIAKHTYDKYGFKVTDEDEDYYYMSVG